MKTVLLTRPKIQARESVQKLESMGFRVLHASMSEPVSMNFQIPDRDRCLIVTSQNGAFYGLQGIEHKDHPIYAVGQKTADTARAMGFSNIFVGPGTAAGLMTELMKAGKSFGYKFTHLCGEDLAHNIAASLSAQGIDANSAVTYAMQPAFDLSSEVTLALNEGAVDSVLFYSARAAQRFEELVMNAGHPEWLSNMTALCFSSRIQAELLGPWQKRKHAIIPSEKALFSLLTGSNT